MRLAFLALAVSLGMSALAAVRSDERPRVLFQRSMQKSGIPEEGPFGLVEYQCSVSKPQAKNPFRDASFAAIVTTPSGKTVAVPGFCADDAGELYRVRFMPTENGPHTIQLTFAEGADRVVSESRFDVQGKPLPGPIRVDPDHPHHFIRAGSNEHYFWNGTTTYWLLGVQDDARISQAIDRLARLKVNRIRVALNARTKDGSRWYEPQVTNSKLFQFRVNPWPAKDPDNVENPQFDTSRFNLPMWEKLDRLVAHARARGVIVSIIFHLDGRDKGVDPFNGGKKQGEGYSDYRAEEFYYRYAIARLAGFSNVTWDVTNEWHLFRDEKWVNHFGGLIRATDPFRHLISVHGRGDFPFYRSPWADFAMYQSWDENGGYRFLRKARELADKAGRPMPQINEEYGYEDHYPGPWGGGRKKPARSADNRRRLAWEMSMAGGYQTTGERADEPGMGGWINGLGNDKMTMLIGYGYLVDFFTSFPWWKCDPVDGLADGGALVLAEPMQRYVMYAPRGGTVNVKVPAGDWQVKRYNPRTGQWAKPLPVAAKGDGLTVAFADADDWVARIEK
jgi:hypothetical protein